MHFMHLHGNDDYAWWFYVHKDILFFMIYIIFWDFFDIKIIKEKIYLVIKLFFILKFIYFHENFYRCLLSL